MEHVEFAGIRIAYRRRGDGPTLLLLHGAVCDSRVWSAELEAFADEFSVVAWDAPGCGRSSDPPEDFRMPDFARCLAGFVDALDIAPAHVLGHSWGTTLAMELYRQRPDSVRTLLLIGAYAGWGGSLPPDEVQQRLSFALRIAELGSGAFEPTSMRGLFSDVMPADRAAQLSTIMAEIRPAGTRTMAYALAESDQRDLLPQIRVPTLLLYGDKDERSGLTVAEELHTAIPTASLVVMPGLGHECYLEAADAFHAEVRNYLLAL